MAKKELRGHVGPCPCCGHEDMEVRNDKNGHPYGYCPMCSIQVLTHGRPERVLPMLKRMRACNCTGSVTGSVTVTEGKGAPAPAPASVTHSLREGKPVATAPAKPEPKAPPAAPEPKARTSSWAVLLDRDEVTA